MLRVIFNKGIERTKAELAADELVPELRFERMAKRDQMSGR